MDPQASARAVQDLRHVEGALRHALGKTTPAGTSIDPAVEQDGQPAHRRLNGPP
jgi:hypothetical protein